MRKATSSNDITHAEAVKTAQLGTSCPPWCTHRDQHGADDGAPLCFTPAVRVVLSDPGQADSAPTVYGTQVPGSESPRIAVDRGDQPGFELTVTEAIRLAETVFAVLEQVQS